MRPNSLIRHGRYPAATGSAAGFTMVELMIVCTVIGILLAVGVPSYKYVTTANRVAAEVNGLLGDLQFARSEAIKEGQTISLCPTSDGAHCLTTSSTWQTGWLVFLDVNGDGIITAGTDQLLRVQKPFSGSDTFQVDNGLTYVTFNRDGFMMNLAGGVTFTLHDATSNANYTRCLSATIVGALSTQRSGQTTSEGAACT